VLQDMLAERRAARQLAEAEVDTPSEAK